MTFRHRLAIVSLVATASLLSASSRALTFLDDVHADVGIAYDIPNGPWDLHVHDEDNNVEYDPAEVVLMANENTWKTRPSGTQYDFLGVPEGGKFNWLPAVFEPEVLYLGVGSEEMPGNFFDRYDASSESGNRVRGNARWIRLWLRSVEGPGAFSVWQTGASGPVVFMASSDGITDFDSLWINEGGHAHYNWGFSQPGRYNVTFQASAFKNGQLLESELVTYQFEAVPEPASLLALGAGLATLASRRRRR